MRAKLPFYLVLGVVALATVYVLIQMFSSPSEESSSESASRMKTREGTSGKKQIEKRAPKKEGLFQSMWGSSDAKDRFGRDVKERAEIELNTQNMKSLFEQGEMNQVKAKLDKLLEDHPNVPEYVAMLGDYYLALDQYKEAEETVRKLLELDPKNTFARETLSRTLAVRGQMDEARDEIYKVLRDSPRSESAMQKMATYAEMQGNPEQGIEDLRKIIDDNPNNGNAYVVLGERLAEQGNSEEAFKVSQEGAAKDPSVPGNHRNLSIQYAMRGDNVNYLEHSRQWADLETNPEYKAAAELNLLLALGQNGRTDEQYETAMNIETSDPELQSKIEEIIRTHKGRQSKAAPNRKK